MILYECTPNKPVIRQIDFYDDRRDPWLYIYRYQGDKTLVRKMLNTALVMVHRGYNYNYKNPSFGPVDWCCVTWVSYCIYDAGMMGDRVWKFGSSAQEYIYSPRYGDGYDSMLVNNGWKKYIYQDSFDLQEGDLVQSNAHIAIIGQIETRYKMDYLPTLKIGDHSNAVRDLQALLNLWTTQNGKNPRIREDGVFGTETEERLKRYQKLQGLTPDGICGYETWNDLFM